MKVKEACEIAEDCGLETIGEAILNIELHAPSLFSYSELNKELDELYTDAKNYNIDEPINGGSKCLMADYCIYSFHNKYCKASKEIIKNCPYLQSIEEIAKLNIEK